MSNADLRRLGQITEPEPCNPMEVEGVLNPAVARGPDGQPCRFPRLVAKDNHSRIGFAPLDVPDHLPPGAPADGDGPTRTSQ